jgi:hypothetical protein
MALLEERRRKLDAEGLFAQERKRELPYLPAVIGVVTSPTGAVIRDILHRLEDRFPRRVLVWPARMQGDGSAEEVAAGIRGFNALEAGGGVPRPDVLIVARGGGSLEDLWSFNEEIVVRAAAESAIPLVSAVGHETDWTLLDHAADVRAPTPTGAAERVVPVRAELAAEVADLSRRHGEATVRGLQRRRSDLRGVARCIPKPEALFNAARARLEGPGNRLVTVYLQNLRGVDARLRRTAVVLQRQSPLARLAAGRARPRRDRPPPRRGPAPLGRDPGREAAPTRPAPPGRPGRGGPGRAPAPSEGPRPGRLGRPAPGNRLAPPGGAQAGALRHALLRVREPELQVRPRPRLRPGTRRRRVPAPRRGGGGAGSSPGPGVRGRFGAGDGGRRPRGETEARAHGSRARHLFDG